MYLYLATAEITTANACSTDQPGKGWVRAEGLHSPRGPLGDWLQTYVLGHWFDLAAPTCGCEEPESRKRVNRQWCCTIGAQSFQQQHSFTAVLSWPFISPTTSHSSLRCVGTVVPHPMPWTVLRNWSSVQKLISGVFIFLFICLVSPFFGGWGGVGCVFLFLLTLRQQGKTPSTKLAVLLPRL